MQKDASTYSMMFPLFKRSKMLATGVLQLDQYDPLIVKYSKDAETYPLLCKAQMFVESAMNTLAVSPDVPCKADHSNGLMQITADCIGITDTKSTDTANPAYMQSLFNPNYNLEQWAKIFKSILAKYLGKQVSGWAYALTLANYNTGKTYSGPNALDQKGANYISANYQAIAYFQMLATQNGLL